MLSGRLSFFSSSFSCLSVCSVVCQIHSILIASSPFSYLPVSSLLCGSYGQFVLIFFYLAVLGVIKAAVLRRYVGTGPKRAREELFSSCLDFDYILAIPEEGIE